MTTPICIIISIAVVSWTVSVWKDTKNIPPAIALAAVCITYVFGLVLSPSYEAAESFSRACMCGSSIFAACLFTVFAVTDIIIVIKMILERKRDPKREKLLAVSISVGIEAAIIAGAIAAVV